MTSSSSVWVLLYYEDSRRGRTTSVKKPKDVEESEWNIDALAKKVLPKLDPSELAEVFVYPPGTTAPFSQNNSIPPAKKLEKVIEELKEQNTSPTTGEHPLIVVAPDPNGPHRQQQGPREKKRRLEDLLFYHRAAIETGTSKSSKLARVKKLGDGSTRCYLCGNAGTATNKIEASHVLQKQDIYATGGEEALLTLDTLKNWSAGFGWKRPFKMHDPMNLIWLCHSHNLAFDRHEFGLSLGGLDGRVVFFSYLDEYGSLVTDANARLADAAQPFYDMSYVSRRAIGMRLCKAQSAGYFVEHGNPQALEAVVALSAAASLKHENDSEDEDEQATASAD